jgi:hypothetical protein
MICGNCQQVITYDKAVVAQHLDGHCHVVEISVFTFQVVTGASGKLDVCLFKTAGLIVQENGTIIRVNFGGKVFLVKVTAHINLDWDTINYTGELQ